jgi:ABC-type polysaccharide/polyol phosphate export permease
MSIWGALAGGFVGTLVLTSGLRFATEVRATRIDLPFLLGTAFTSDRRRAAALGYVLHFLAGLIFAIVYYAVFQAIGESSWWLGAAFGFLHAVFAGTALVSVLLPIVHPRMGTVHTAANSSPQLEPPGFLLLNYGRSTPVLMVALHIAYGAIVGAFAALSG